MTAMLWVCPRCGVRQNPSEVRTVEVTEPGKGQCITFYGKIRPYGSEDGPIAFSCLVCGNVWWAGDPTPGGASVTFLHPINETNDEIAGCCIDRDAC